MALPLIVVESKDHKLTFDPNPRKHIYTLDGNIVPGVTTVNKLGYPTPQRLLNWYMANGRKSKQIAADAAEIGKILHKYAELRVLGQGDKFDWKEVNEHPDADLIKTCIEHFEKWLSQNTTRTLGTEMLVASPTYQFAGTLDRLSANEKDEAGIEDHKTSSSFFLDNFVQMAGYKIALYEWKDIEAKWFRINLFSKTRAQFHTLLVNREGWTLDDKLIVTDSFAMQKLESQFLRNRKTYSFVHEYEILFDDIYEKIKEE